VNIEGGCAVSSLVRFMVSWAGVSGEATEKEELALVSGPRPRSKEVSQIERERESRAGEGVQRVGRGSSLRLRLRRTMVVDGAGADNVDIGVAIVAGR
jgi:hypothetical protein